MTRLFVYKVARDFGFAPNPFWGVCTLATCKPKIRSVAKVGDLVVGVGTRARLRDRIIFAMRVQEKMGFDAYWADERFKLKRPTFFHNMRRAVGDNIYHRDGGAWVQADSHHSGVGGVVNMDNLKRDTSADAVLSSSDFVYWGAKAVPFPAGFGKFFSVGRSHRSVYPQDVIDTVEAWFDGLPHRGRIGRPADFDLLK